ncbi:hypothetical protein [Paenibacillus senegalimassiliensis]|uniref:hypothetical protein n=1 Tax=Paenibacillus senegalimassiliensis TaxID=1737426 RepID=UPI00073F4E68|nr:hypothetical protein [Paenibacillus senegalimassiliensis]
MKPIKVIIRSTMDDFDEKEIVLSENEIAALKHVDFIEMEKDEINTGRFRVFELVYDLDTRRFVLWIDKEE